MGILGIQIKKNISISYLILFTHSPLINKLGGRNSFEFARMDFNLLLLTQSCTSLKKPKPDRPYNKNDSLILQRYLDLFVADKVLLHKKLC